MASSGHPTITFPCYIYTLWKKKQIVYIPITVPHFAWLLTCPQGTPINLVPDNCHCRPAKPCRSSWLTRVMFLSFLAINTCKYI